jgi:hypothetical protein
MTWLIYIHFLVTSIAQITNKVAAVQFWVNNWVRYLPLIHIKLPWIVMDSLCPSKSFLSGWILLIIFDNWCFNYSNSQNYQENYVCELWSQYFVALIEIFAMTWKFFNLDMFCFFQHCSKHYKSHNS